MLLAMFGTMILLLLMGFPMMIPLVAGALICFLIEFPTLDKLIIAQQIVGGIQPVTLIAIPLYIFSAEIITSGQSANRLIKFVMSFVGHIRGGLPITTCGSCTLFGAISGSTMATVAAIGGALRPKLLKNGYPSGFSSALIINASDIALLIPPSLGAIMYGVVSGTSIGELFIAGIGPGVLIFLLFSVYSYIFSRVKKIPVQPKLTWSERLKSAKQSYLTLGYPVIVIGGIYSGFLSPTEAAAFAIVYAIILEGFIYKAVKLADFSRIALSTGVVTSVIFILIGAGTIFSWAISFARIPAEILPVVLGSNPSALKILFVICIANFVACMFVDPVVVIFILTPILHPLAVNAGIDPVLVGTMVTLQAAIGSATPPFGCDIFVAMAVFKRPYFEIIKGTPPFIVILIVVSILLIVFPEIALFLRDLAFPR
jgi:C4-dicarboxylate transporter, DctM subunit